MISPYSGTPTILASVSGEQGVMGSRAEIGSGVRGGRGREGERSRDAFSKHSLQKLAGGGYFYSKICSFSFVFLFYLD